MKAISRRVAMALAMVFCVKSVQAGEVVEPPLDEIIRRTEEEAQAFVSGDMTRWAAMIKLAKDFTLMQPFGGPVSHGFDDSPERLAVLARNFRKGDAHLEVAKSYTSSDLIVLVIIERQHGEVAGLPDQDWSLRVTQVYRREGSEWRLAHRHADPLVRNIGPEKTAALARGE
ncbi:nuclear transport factor 2 family protein [Neorhizobium sp. DT-125]|uniref:nuclear transport factor 2 family protein n=1 Tax=Neorhizobium sp. DT-125 TaxID=3396163 RepID=UPI003F1C497B